MKIYLVRHGQTLFNIKKRVQGWCDSPLSEEGIKQAKALGKGLQEIDFAAAYSSTSERAMDTANLIIGERAISLTSLKGLKEMNFGTLEGEYEEDVLKKDGSSHQIGFAEFGGETIIMTQKRMLNTLENIAQQHAGENVLVVSHGGAIMSTLFGIDEVKLQNYFNGDSFIDNCSVTVLAYRKNFTIETIADMSYVEKGMKGD